ncbi:hypothetical protein G5B30_06675 [Sphingobacterium sp. SGG-5]|uniref:IPT/TIG domain-containing protein n=1 Tax=Sphingobacterium sp. SGG-5 TaxID=2710881 RepID=UPI0013EDEE34|nr:IPT/TIG domain-containing protein [Sphingobacterium sp. SGG-5]NGM61599.1 hypothetical protein [Sphingobacterium sp. SGG-5]
MKNIKTYIFSSLLLLTGMVSCKEENTGYTNDPSAPVVVDDFFPKQGGGGTEILINGSNFSSDTSAISVTVNGIPLKIIGASGTQIMAVIPKKLGAGKLEISIGNNTGVSTQSFDYRFTRTVSTLAGNGTAGFANGQGADAMFNFVGDGGWYRSTGIAVDDDLNVYVADPGNFCIRKIDPDGNVTTFAGNPNASGSADGNGVQAQFSLVYGLAIDKQGNLYVADPGNWNIRKITPNGDVTTVISTYSDPWSIALDQVGNIYYSCPNVGNIYSVSPHEAIATGIDYPGGIAIDQGGNLYASSVDHTIKKYAANTWTGSIIAGQPYVAGYVNGTGSAALFSAPWGLATDNDGNLYVAGNGTWDGGLNADQSIRMIETATGKVSTFAGSGTAGFVNAIGESAAFSGPGGVCVDKNGTVYVLDKRNNAIRKIVSE